jgi:hypothetical protein
LKEGELWCKYLVISMQHQLLDFESLILSAVIEVSNFSESQHKVTKKGFLSKNLPQVP